jgi:hypothetical protein
VNGYTFTPDRYAPLELFEISSEGADLSVDDFCVGKALSQAGACVIDIAWAPRNAYVLEGRLTVTSNAPTSPTIISIVGTATP